MSHAAVFSQRLCALQSPAELINRLHLLDPLIYLYNQGQAVIGCFPEQYCVLQPHGMQYFQATGLNEYSQSAAQDFSALIQSTTTSAEQKRFTGGVMGFISYDHGAA